MPGVIITILAIVALVYYVLGTITASASKHLGSEEIEPKNAGETMAYGMVVSIFVIPAVALLCVLMGIG